MSSPSQTLSLGAAVDFQIDPNIPQSSQESVAQINDATKAQVALINATTKSGGRRRRRQKSLSYKGGDIVVAPLPLGTPLSANAQDNNVAAAKLFANAVSASTYDNAVIPPKVGGKRRRRTRRLSKKRTRRRSTKYRKMMKGKKSRRTRRR